MTQPKAKPELQQLIERASRLAHDRREREQSELGEEELDDVAGGGGEIGGTMGYMQKVRRTSGVAIEG
jgi:hypothetical protein